MRALASPTVGKGDAKAPGWTSVWRVPIIQAQAPIHHAVNVVKSHSWGWRKKRGGLFASERFPGISQILGDPWKVRPSHRGWTPHASPLLPRRQPGDGAGDVVGLQSFLAFPNYLWRAVLGIEPLGGPALAHPAWHPAGAPSAGSVFTKVQKEIVGRHGITFTSLFLGCSLWGTTFTGESRPHNFITMFVTEVREMNALTILPREMYFK